MSVIQEVLSEATLPLEIVRRVMYLRLKLHNIDEIGPYRVLVGFDLNQRYSFSLLSLGDRLRRLDGVDEVVQSPDVGLIRLELL